MPYRAHAVCQFIVESTSPLDGDGWMWSRTMACPWQNFPGPSMAGQGNGASSSFRVSANSYVAGLSSSDGPSSFFPPLSRTLSAMATNGLQSSYACRCLNVRIHPLPAQGSPPVATNDFHPVYVGDEGIAVVRQVLTFCAKFR